MQARIEINMEAKLKVMLEANTASMLTQLRGLMSAPNTPAAPPQSTPSAPIKPSLADEFSEAMPVRNSAPAELSRVSGEARMQLRLATLKRMLMEESSTISAEEFARLESAMANAFTAPKVPFPLTHTALELGGQQRRPARDFFADLQFHGLAPMSASDAAEQAFLKIFKEMGEKEMKDTLNVKSWHAFCQLTLKGNFLAPERLQSDPDSYWAWSWHFHGMCYLNNNVGWAAAQMYHHNDEKDGVMDRWMQGFLDPAFFTNGPEFRRGDVVGSLDQRAYMKCLALSRTPSKQVQDYNKTGATAKATDSDTWCEFHGMFYPKAAKHSLTAAGVGTCRAGLSALGGGKGGGRKRL